MNKYKNMIVRVGLAIVASLLIMISFASCGQPDSLNKIKKAFNFPNPMEPTGSDDSLKKTTIRIEFENNTFITKSRVEVKISDSTGCEVWFFEREIPISTGSQNIDVEWFGKNGKGKIVSQGLYTADIKLKALESGSGTPPTIGGDVLTDKVIIAVK